MPKAEKGSIKDLGKRIKAKGLQKLRFWCEMCQKQCRDANGFKCHVQSESHLRQMKLFSDNAGSIVNSKSREFENVFLETLRMRHSTVKVNANNVYQEVIKERTHVHMNATQWATLSDFVQYLGKHGKCVVEENERGWYITYIDRDVNKLAKQQQHQERMQADAAAEAAYAAQMDQQRRAAAEQDAALLEDRQVTKLERDGENNTVKLSLNNTAVVKSKATATSSKPKSTKRSVFGSDDEEEEDVNDGPGMPPGPPPLPVAPVQPIQSSSKKRPPPTSRGDDADRHDGDKHQPESDRKQSSKKRHRSSDDHRIKEKTADSSSSSSWLYRDIVVRIVDPDHRYYKRKAVVESAPSERTQPATVVPLDSPDKELHILEQDLETVIPKQQDVDDNPKKHARVRILKGRYRGKKAVVVHLDKKKYRAVLELKDGTRLEKVDFEDFSLLA